MSQETASGVIRLDPPAAGQILTIPINADDMRLALGFVPDPGAVAQNGRNLEFAFENGGRIVLEGYYDHFADGTLPAMVTEAGDELPGEAFLAALDEDLLTAAGPASVPASGGIGEYDDGSGALVAAALVAGVDRLGADTFAWTPADFPGDDADLFAAVASGGLPEAVAGPGPVGPPHGGNPDPEDPVLGGDNPDPGVPPFGDDDAPVGGGTTITTGWDGSDGFGASPKSPTWYLTENGDGDELTGRSGNNILEITGAAGANLNGSNAGGGGFGYAEHDQGKVGGPGSLMDGEYLDFTFKQGMPFDFQVTFRQHQQGDPVDGGDTLAWQVGYTNDEGEFVETNHGDHSLDTWKLSLTAGDFADVPADVEAVVRVTPHLDGNEAIQVSGIATGVVTAAGDPPAAPLAVFFTAEDGDENNTILFGGMGDDTRYGGSGDDIFAWKAEDMREGAIDVIMDFSLGRDLLRFDLAQLDDEEFDNGRDSLEALLTGGALTLGTGGGDLKLTVRDDGQDISQTVRIHLEGECTVTVDDSGQFRTLDAFEVADTGTFGEHALLLQQIIVNSGG